MRLRVKLGPPDGFVAPGLSRLTTRVFYALVARVEVTGQERVPPTGPLIVASNHLHLADPPLLVATVPRDLTQLAKEELFQVPLIGGVLRLAGGFAIRRGEADRRAIRTALEILKRGGTVVVFPEGTRSKTGVLQEGNRGVAVLAHLSGAPIVPVGITGTDAFRRLSTALRRPQLTVRFGEVFRLDARRGADAEKAATDEVMRRIAALLPLDRRGRYA